jgi:hypothetical protein
LFLLMKENAREIAPKKTQIQTQPQGRRLGFEEQQQQVEVKEDQSDEKSPADEFDKIAAEIWDEMIAESDTIYFPAEVIASLETLGKPSWELVRDAMQAQLQEDRFEQLHQEVMRLMKDEDLFEWPVQDPLRCLTIGIFRKFAKRFTDKTFKNFNLDDDETEGDEADWWKAAQ